MQQVLFHIPILKESFPPDGIPVHGFGVMLFITFMACVGFLGWRSRRTGVNVPKERVQDLVISVFVGGLVGARLTYLIQYDRPLVEFIRIWEGGIVLYGGIVSGCLAFYLFHRYLLRRVGITFWKLADVCAPGLALGIALGRLGCFLNGCCYGHVAPDNCPSSGFPLLTCPAQEKVVGVYAYQTLTGFTVKPGAQGPQSVVTGVEPSSAAERAGLQIGDRIVGLNGQQNQCVLLITGQPEAVEKAASIARESGAEVVAFGDRKEQIRVIVDGQSELSKLRQSIEKIVPVPPRAVPFDSFTDLMADVREGRTRGRDTLALEVERAGQTLVISPFKPRTVGLHPTQIYETISMLLLVVFLLAFYPYRRYDGQIFTLFLAIYAVHRFLNERLRNDTEIVGLPALNMTLSQNISVLMLLVALGLEIYQRKYGTRVGSPAAVV